MQKHFYLPEPQTDFIFAIFLEEFGLIVGVLLAGMYGYMFVTVFNQATKVKDLFGSFFNDWNYFNDWNSNFDQSWSSCRFISSNGSNFAVNVLRRIVIDDYAYCNWNCY